MSDPFRAIDDYELFLYALTEQFPSIRRSTLVLERRGALGAEIEALVHEIGHRERPMTAKDAVAPATSLEVRSRLVEALKLALVGPGAGHALAEERLHRRERAVELVSDGLPDPLGDLA